MANTSTRTTPALKTTSRIFLLGTEILSITALTGDEGLVEVVNFQTTWPASWSSPSLAGKGQLRVHLHPQTRTINSTSFIDPTKAAWIVHPVPGGAWASAATDAYQAPEPEYRSWVEKGGIMASVALGAAAAQPEIGIPVIAALAAADKFIDYVIKQTAPERPWYNRNHPIINPTAIGLGFTWTQYNWRAETQPTTEVTLNLVEHYGAQGYVGASVIPHFKQHKTGYRVTRLGAFGG